MEICQHDDRPKQAHGLCWTCYKRHLRRTNPEYRDRNRARVKRWKKDNPELHREQTRRAKQRRKERLGPRAIHAMRTYKITHAEYLALLAKYGNTCGICGIEADLFIDHDHATGIVRGMLCLKCNSGLGMFEDDVESLYMAASYLERSSQESRPFAAKLQKGAI
jgi:hypothetical protein